MTTPCHAVDCRRTADIKVGNRTLLCAFHYKQEPAYAATPERRAEIEARVAELQGGAA